MALTVEDRFAITDIVNLHGHLTDRGDFDGLSALFTDDVTYDVSALGGGVLAGLAGIREAALALGDANPVAHHVTNIVLAETADGSVRALSKGLGVMTDGSVGSVTTDHGAHSDPGGLDAAHPVDADLDGAEAEAEDGDDRRDGQGQLGTDHARLVGPRSTVSHRSPARR